jgi:hypothetical protein
MDAKTWAAINGEYQMPPDAGPAWRAAFAAGEDMSQIEDNLALTPEERIRQLQFSVNSLLEIYGKGFQERSEL